MVRGGPDGRGTCKGFEESPDSTRQRCRVTPGWGNPRESATENRPPCNPLKWIIWVRVKRWGKSPPRDGQPDRHGKPHREQCQIGTARGAGRATDTARRHVLAQRSGLAARGALVTGRQDEWSSMGGNPRDRIRLTGPPRIFFEVYKNSARVPQARCLNRATARCGGAAPNVEFRRNSTTPEVFWPRKNEACGLKRICGGQMTHGLGAILLSLGDSGVKMGACLTHGPSHRQMMPPHALRSGRTGLCRAAGLRPLFWARLP